MKNALFFLAAILLLTVSCTDNQIQLNGDEPEPTLRQSGSSLL